MNRATWRDVVVDVSTLLILFGAVVLKFWTISAAAPWMVAVAAGRWGASTISKYAAAKAGTAGAPLASRLSPPASVPPPAQPALSPASSLLPPSSTSPVLAAVPVAIVHEAVDAPDVEAQEEAPLSKPLPTSGIVLVLFAIGTAIVLFLKNRSA